MRTRENIRHLRENGPTPLVDLPYDLGLEDRRRGAATFRVNAEEQGSTYGVGYLLDDHDPEDVIRVFLERNPKVAELSTRRGLVERIGGYGRSWREAARNVVYEMVDP